jgi:acetyltransferase
MRRLFEEARLRGLREMWGTVLAQNALMLELAHRLGAQREAVAGEPDVVRVRFDLRKPRRNQKRT